MLSQIELSKSILQEFLRQSKAATDPQIDRKEIVAHATLSALLHHWPDLGARLGGSDLKLLLEETCIIVTTERSRWLVQRRIAIAKIHRKLEASQADQKEKASAL